MTAAVRAGVVYVAILFAVGFVLGTLRVLVLLPRLGELGAVLLELPVVLGLSWVVCGRLVSRFRVPPGLRHRLAMGGTAFGLLMIAELLVSLLAFGRSPAEHLAGYRSWTGSLGLAAQLVFAALPLVRGRQGAIGRRAR
jgi:hypothetical protein